MRKPFLAGNWKMYKTVPEAVALARALVEKVGQYEKVDITVCPNALALGAVAEAVKGSRISVGAQHMHWEDEGAFTGEVSARMILSAGAKLAIIGHSERRHIFGETDEMVNRKLKAALAAGLSPIVCVGETLDQREKGITDEVVSRQLEGGLKGVGKDELPKLTIAYEPVWAIGTGKTATPDMAQKVHALIRRLLADSHGEGFAQAVRVQYGGSVKPANVASLMEMPDIDGALVGGASLDAESFSKIVRYAEG